MLRFPDAETLVRTYLETHLEADLSTEVPAETDWQHTPTLIVVNATGPGLTEYVLDEVHYGFTCYAPTGVQASALAADVRFHMQGWPIVNDAIYRFRELARPQLTPDSDTGYPAYWYSCSLRIGVQAA